MATFAIPTLTHAGPGLFKRKTKPVVEEPVPQPEPPAPAPLPPPPTLDGSLFSEALPLDFGSHPEGLANVSAQGCHGCHPDAVAAWQAGPHTSPSLQSVLSAASRSGASACAGCHLPLINQHDMLPSWETEVTGAANEFWSATLRMEGATCTACHIRDGRVIVGTADAARRPGPHMNAYSAELGSSESCGACHQLTWPGANLPLYDTYGEWKRSAWAAADVGCMDCHASPGSMHVAPADTARAVSVLLDLPSPTLVRGGEAVSGTLRLQNTGAGHAVPTGTPFRGLRVTAGLARPGESEVTVELFATHLARTLSDQPPWSTTEDTRLPAGGASEWAFDLALDTNNPAGRWELVVRLLPTLHGDVDGDAVLERRLGLVVQ